MMIINSVFTVFRLNLLFHNHLQTLERAETISSFNCCIVQKALSKLVSSAYIITLTSLTQVWKVIHVNNKE